MTAPHIVDPAHVLGNLLTQASPDMMRTLLQTLINALLSADADQVCGAEWGQPSADRLAQRNGYRHRPAPGKRHANVIFSASGPSISLTTGAVSSDRKSVV